LPPTHNAHTLPSMHYLKRIDREKNISVPIYLNVMIDVMRRKFIAIRHHAKKSGEVPDAYSIIPVKKNWAKGQYRKQLKDFFDYYLYWQRYLW